MKQKWHVMFLLNVNRHLGKTQRYDVRAGKPCDVRVRLKYIDSEFILQYYELFGVHLTFLLNIIDMIFMHSYAYNLQEIGFYTQGLPCYMELNGHLCVVTISFRPDDLTTGMKPLPVGQLANPFQGQPSAYAIKRRV